MHNAYGARDLLAEHTGLSQRFLSGTNLIWQHGWIPKQLNSDIDLIVSESGETSHLTDFLYFVSREDQAKVLGDAGLTGAHAIGLPYAYALKKNQEKFVRQSQSLLVMPGSDVHVEPDGTEINFDEQYIAYLRKQLRFSSNHLVVFRGSDFAKGRQKLWEREGFTVARGASEESADSLTWMVKLFSSFDYVTTNGFSSALVYAGAAGCRVSIAGPIPTVPERVLYDGSLVRSRPELGPVYADFFAPQTLRNIGEEASVVTEPFDARQCVEWSYQEIGMNLTLDGENLKKLVQSETRRLRRPRIPQLFQVVGELPLKLKAKRTKIKAERFSDTNPDKNTEMPKGSTFAPPLVHGSVRGSKRQLWFRPLSEDIRDMQSRFHQVPTIPPGDFTRFLFLGCGPGFSIEKIRSARPLSTFAGVDMWEENITLANLNFTDIDNVFFLDSAVWSEATRLSAIHPTPPGTRAKLAPVNFGQPNMATLTVQEVLEQFNWKKVDVIVMNIGGAEYRVLESASSFISSLCDILAVSFHHKVARRAEYKRIVEQLNQHSTHRPDSRNDVDVFDFRTHRH